MKLRIVMGITLAMLALLAGVAAAGTNTRLGTEGATELRLPVGARNVALAGADIGSVSGAEAIFYNPAGIASTDAKTDVMFANTQYIADIKINYIAIAQNMGGFGNVGFSAKVVSLGTMDFTTETAPDGTGETFSPTFSTLGITYAKQMTDRVNFGGTLYYVGEHILQETAAGVAFDFGFQYDTGFRGVRLGMTMKNYGPAQEFSGGDFERNLHIPGDNPQSGNRTVGLSSAQFELPSYFVGGASYPFMQGQNALTGHFVYQSNSFGVDDGRVGVEYTYRKMFSLRGGYKITSNSDELFGPSYGLGVRLPMGSSHVQVDYAGQPVSKYFTDVQHVTVSFQF